MSYTGATHKKREKFGSVTCIEVESPEIKGIKEGIIWLIWTNHEIKIMVEHQPNNYHPPDAPSSI